MVTATFWSFLFLFRQYFPDAAALMIQQMTSSRNDNHTYLFYKSIDTQHFCFVPYDLQIKSHDVFYICCFTCCSLQFYNQCPSLVLQQRDVWYISVCFSIMATFNAHQFLTTLQKMELTDLLTDVSFKVHSQNYCFHFVKDPPSFCQSNASSPFLPKQLY